MAATATTTTGVRVKGFGGERVKEALFGYSFIAAPMAVYTILFFYPIVYAIYISRYNWGVLGKIEPNPNVGWGNYRDLFHDHRFGIAVKHGLEFSISFTIFTMVLGLFVAVVVNSAVRGRNFFRSAYYFPSISGSAAIVALALFVLSADGLFNKVTGLRHAWFGESGTALWAIVGLNSWTTSGTVMLFYLAYLQAIPTDVYEAAAIDGAGPWRTFWKVTFPLLRPGHFFVSTLLVIGGLKLFDQAYIASGGNGGPDNATLTPVLILYRVAFNDVRFGYAAALGIALMLLMITLTLIQRLTFGRGGAS
jgi:multiple sugar transport system permease protein